MGGKLPLTKLNDPVFCFGVNRCIMGGDNDCRAVFFVEVSEEIDDQFC